MLRVARYLITAAALTLAMAVFFAAGHNPEVSSMPCQTLEQKQIDEERTRLEKQPRYVPGDKGRASVQFQFNLNPSPAGETLFVIFSNRLHKPVYRGPYRPSVRVEIDDGLSSDKYYDNLEFSLLEFGQKRLCIWTNERGEPYWRPGAHVTIGFLEESTLDKDGLPKRFDIRIQ